MKIFIACALLMFCGQTVALTNDDAPSAIHLTYNIVKAGLVIGTVDEQFIRTGNHYKIISETASAGVIKIFVNDKFIATTEGTITATGLQPDSFEFKRQSDERKTIRAQFNWNSGKLLSTRDSSTETFDLPAGAQDRLSSQYQFMFNATLASEIKVASSQGKGVENYIYRKQGEVQLKTAIGDLTTLHYKRDKRADKSEVEMWLAKDRNHLPMRIVFTDSRGLTLQQDVVSLDVK